MAGVEGGPASEVAEIPGNCLARLKDHGCAAKGSKGPPTYGHPRKVGVWFAMPSRRGPARRRHGKSRAIRMVGLFDADPNVIESKVFQGTEDIVSRHPARERGSPANVKPVKGCCTILLAVKGMPEPQILGFEGRELSWMKGEGAWIEIVRP